MILLVIVIAAVYPFNKCYMLHFEIPLNLLSPLYFRMGLKWSRARSCAFTAWAENAFFSSWSVKSKTLGLTPATPETLLHHATWMFMVKFACFSLKKEKTTTNKQTNSSLQHQVSVFGRTAIASCLCQIHTSTARLFRKSRQQQKKIVAKPIHGNNHQQVLKWKARSVKSCVSWIQNYLPFSVIIIVLTKCNCRVAFSLLPFSGVSFVANFCRFMADFTTAGASDWRESTTKKKKRFGIHEH